MLRYTTDRARPGLVALYDIRPGNGAGQFLQPRSSHGAVKSWPPTKQHPTFYRPDVLPVTQPTVSMHWSTLWPEILFHT